MIFIGDCHGCWNTYSYILNKMQHKGGRTGIDCSLQVGDMGMGFSDNSFGSFGGVSYIETFSKVHLFLRGNHDDPKICNNHPNYIGDWGFVEKPNIFFISGGYSVDYNYRTVGIDWWKNEELTSEEMKNALTLYAVKKPKIVVSHECPIFIKKSVVTNELKLKKDSATEVLLQSMFSIHKPKYWIFGHHHQKKEIDVEGTHFVCLDELIDGKVNNCIYEIKDLTWEG